MNDKTTGAARRNGTRLWSRLLALGCLVAGGLAAQTAGGPEISAIAAGSDTEFGSLVFIADRAAGAVYYANVEQAAADFIAVDEMTELYGHLGRPAALAYGGGKLYVVEGDGPRLLEFDVRKGERRILVDGPPLSNPTSVAVSEDGLVVIGDPGADGLVAVTKTGVQVIQNDFLMQIGDVGFHLPGKLLALDRHTGEVFLLSTESSGLPKEGRAAASQSRQAVRRAAHHGGGERHRVSGRRHRRLRFRGGLRNPGAGIRRRTVGLSHRRDRSRRS